jgi:rhomboid protease GluP
MLVFSLGSIGMQGMFGFASPSTQALFLFGASGSYPVFVAGRWWTVLSAAWLHGSILHILFNMMWVRNLGPSTADLYGGPRMVIIYTAGSIGGFALSSVLGLYGLPLFGAPYTVGASAPIFGLLGALMYYGRRSGSSLIHAEAKGYAVAFFVFGLIMPGIDNAAHAGGFVGGYLAGMRLDPLKPERINHMIIALACLAATGLAIIASIVTGLPFM